jgi:carbonic anhydrase
MHKAKACIILCIDFRFQVETQHWLEIHGYLGESDEIVVAGASRDLVVPLEPFHKESLLRQIELSVKLHDPEEIVIIDHQDCGGYAQDGTIPAGLSLDDDKMKHIEYAEKVKQILHEKFPNKNIKTFYVKLDGGIDEI